MHSAGADMARTEKNFFSGGCSVWIVVSGRFYAKKA